MATQNQALINYDLSKLFSTDFKTITGTYTNASGNEVTLTEGMLFGRIHATGKLAILKSGSSDGAQIPLGVNVTYAVVANSASTTITLAVTGRVNVDLLILDGTDTLDTVIDNRRLRDRIPSDTEGIQLESFTQLSNYENQ